MPLTPEERHAVRDEIAALNRKIARDVYIMHHVAKTYEAVIATVDQFHRRMLELDELHALLVEGEPLSHNRPSDKQRQCDNGSP